MMYQRFTEQSRLIFLVANKAASSRRQAVGPVHLLVAITSGQSLASKALEDLGVDEPLVAAHLPSPTAPARTRGVEMGSLTRHLIGFAAEYADRLGDDKISTHHILLVLADKRLSPGTSTLLKSIGVDCDALRHRILRDLSQLRKQSISG